MKENNEKKVKPEMQIYCIVDNVADKVLPLWEAENENVMRRMIATTFKNPSPEDFEVVHFGNRYGTMLNSSEGGKVYQVKEIIEEYKVEKNG